MSFDRRWDEYEGQRQARCLRDRDFERVTGSRLTRAEAYDPECATESLRGGWLGRGPRFKPLTEAQIDECARAGLRALRENHEAIQSDRIGGVDSALGSDVFGAVRDAGLRAEPRSEAV